MFNMSRDDCQLQPYDILIAFTDGISEAMTADYEEWGEERLIAAARMSTHRSAQDLVTALIASPRTSSPREHRRMTTSRWSSLRCSEMFRRLVAWTFLCLAAAALRAAKRRRWSMPPS